MRILVDHQIFLRQQVGGISRYHYELCKAINSILEKKSCEILAIGSSNIYLNPTRIKRTKLLRFQFLTRILTKINERYILSQLKKFDILHPTYYDNYFLKSTRKTPLVVTIHDLIPEKYFPIDAKELIENKKTLVKSAEAIICVSNATKQELIEAYNCSFHKIHVIHHGFTRHRDKQNQIVSNRAAYNTILFVGNRDGYKNFSFFINGISKIAEERDLSIIIVGKAFTSYELAQIARTNLSHRITLKTQVADDMLFSLYASALCFVFPALDEGFGMPILEAFEASCPVICSDIPVFREIAEAAAVYFNPTEINELESAIQTLILRKELRQALIIAGHKRLKEFSWEKAAVKTLQVYEALVTTTTTTV